jgi:hypothetical protein
MFGRSGKGLAAALAATASASAVSGPPPPPNSPTGKRSRMSRPAGILARNSLSTSPRVSSVRGTTSTTMSACGSSWRASATAWTPFRACRATIVDSASKAHKASCDLLTNISGADHQHPLARKFVRHGRCPLVPLLCACEAKKLTQTRQNRRQHPLGRRGPEHPSAVASRHASGTTFSNISTPAERAWTTRRRGIAATSPHRARRAAEPRIRCARCEEAIAAPAPLALQCSLADCWLLHYASRGHAGWPAVAASNQRQAMLVLTLRVRKTPGSRRPPPTPTPTRIERVLDPCRGRRWNARSIGHWLQTPVVSGV